MGAERSAVAAWVASWDDRERAGALAGVEEKARALREAFGAEAASDEAELLAGAVFLEYAERTGVCPLELHWILGDAAAASREAVLSVRVQMMIEDAAGRRAGRGTPRVVGRDGPCDRRADEGRGVRGDVAHPDSSPGRGARGR